MDSKSIKTLEFDKIREKVASFAVLDEGKELLNALMPETDAIEVEKLLDETDEAAKIIEKRGSSPVSRCGNMGEVLARISVGATLSMRELLTAAGFLNAVRTARRGICNDEEEEDTGTVKELARLLVPMRDIEEEIYADILSEDEMADSASPALASIRRQIRKLSDSIKDRLNSLVKSLEKDGVLQEGIITMRSDRYVLPVIAAHKGKVPGIVHDQSSSGATLFIEPMAVVEINNSIRQLKLDERDEILRILEELSARLKANESALKSNSEILIKLDVIFAKAKYARETDAVKPKINKKGFVNIKSGKHPLLDARKAVPISIWLGKDFTELLVTGPNTGGKTVTLKTVGLFALMSQSGLFLPALPGSEMPVFDEIFADIGDEQSIEQNLSTFSSHMKNIARIMKSLTPDSLVLFDELGAGTDPAEGAALAMSILEELRKRRIRTVVTSHYAELKAYSLSHAGCENASVEFDVKSLKPTYRLMVGVPGSSNAFLISAKLGLDRYLIDRARNYVDEDSRKIEKVLSNAEEYRAAAQSERLEAQQARAEINRAKKEIEKEQAELAKQREKFIKQAEKDAEKIREKALDEANEIIEKMKSLSGKNPSDIFAAREEKKKLEKKESGTAAEMFVSGEPLKEFTVGENVFVSTFNKDGMLVSLPNSKGRVMVRMGAIQTEVDKKNLFAPKGEKEKQFTSIKVQRSHASVPMSVDLRGQTVDEALINLDSYLDSAILGSYGSVTVIHGKGTGALRSAVADYLRRDKRVKSQRMGAYGEGDAGVTIVELKG